MRRTLCCIGVMCVALLLGGCRNLVSSPAAFEVYDLGRGDLAADPPRLVPSRVELISPTWLSSTAMHYRLDYLPVASREAYGTSRWAGQPGEMLERLIEAGLSRRAAQGSRCRLLLDLDDFVQRFESQTHSRSEIAVRAQLIAPRREAVLARESFMITVASATPDAKGGVEAHRDGAGQLVGELAAWLDGLADDPDSRVVRWCLGSWREFEQRAD